MQLENNNIDQAAQILVSFSATARGAVAMRKAGCLPLLVSLVHCETAAPPSSPEEKKMVQLGTQAMQNLGTFLTNHALKLMNKKFSCGGLAQLVRGRVSDRKIAGSIPVLGIIRLCATLNANFQTGTLCIVED